MVAANIKITVQSRSAWWWGPCQWLLVATLLPVEAMRLISHRQAMSVLDWILGQAVQFRIGDGPWTKMRVHIPEV